MVWRLNVRKTYLEKVFAVRKFFLNERHDFQPEEQISKLIELQYPKESTLEALKDEWMNVKTDLNMLRRELWDIQTLLLGNRDSALYKIARTRAEKMPDIEVIPEMFREEIEQLEHRLESVYYLVKLPLFPFQRCILPRTEDSRWIYADIEYSKDEGATSCKSGSEAVTI